MKKVFLGGTCNDSTWRDSLIEDLKIDYFNPVVDYWNEEAYEKELKEREECDFCLYVLTSKMTGVYSIAEVIDDSNKRPEKTLFLVSDFDGLFDDKLFKSLMAVEDMVFNNGGTTFGNITGVVAYLNEYS